MAKVVPDDKNHFRTAWNHVRENEGGRQMMADSLGIERGRLNELILGRSRPTLGETNALTGRRRGNYVVYRDSAGKEHSTYTGRGKSFAQMVEDYDELEDMLEDIGAEKDYPVDGNAVVTIRDGYNPRASYHSMSRSIRTYQRRGSVFG